MKNVQLQGNQADINQMIKKDVLIHQNATH